MRLRHDFLSAFPPQAVMAAYCDGVPGFAQGLPMVARVTELEARDEGAIRIRVHRWQGDVGRFPKLLTRLLDARMFQWTTHCCWDVDAGEGTWHLEIGAFGEGRHIEGLHRFLAEGEGCRTEVEGEVLVRASQFSSVGGVRALRPLQATVDRVIARVFREIVAQSGKVVERSLG